MAKREKNPRFITPTGTALFPAFFEPDYGTDDYPKPEGQYKVNLKLTEDDAQALIDKLDPHYKEAIKKAEAEFKKLKPATRKKLKEITINPLFDEVFDDEENETGEKIFKFKRKASGETKNGKQWKAKIGIYDAKAKPITKALNVSTGSEVKVSFEARPYFIPANGACGLSLSLLGVQIIELVEAGVESAEALGFGAEEGGFAYTEANTEGFDEEDQGYESSEEGADDDPDF